MKKAVILFNLGGPDKLENVEPFLFNLFYDPAILNLPSIYVYENNRYTISFGTNEDVKDWKEQEKEWIEQDFSVADDSIKLLCELKKII